MLQGLSKDAPVVVILPGLTGEPCLYRTCPVIPFKCAAWYLEMEGHAAGGSQDSYVQYAIKAAKDVGMRGVVYNPRGLANSPVLTPRLYSASYTGDLRQVHSSWPVLKAWGQRTACSLARHRRNRGFRMQESCDIYTEHAAKRSTICCRLLSGRQPDDQLPG